MTTKTTTRFWVSWHQPTDDVRPLTDPPHPQVLGWWHSGYDGNGVAQLCALVEADHEQEARMYVGISWPEAERWRFCEPRAADWVPGDRFPPTPWMRQRMGLVK